jgi:hypothetical protein
MRHRRYRWCLNLTRVIKTQPRAFVSDIFSPEESKPAITPESPEAVAVARMMCPDTYAEDVLGIKPHPVHRKVLQALFPMKPGQSRVSLRCSNEVGKTSTIAVTAILYAIHMRQAQVISTAGVWMQVAQQLVPQLKRHERHYPGWRFLESSISIRGIDRYIGFSTRDEGFAQGFHRRPDMPLVAIIDEAASVADGIFDGVEDRCNPDYLLVMGSPLDPTGRFYDIETRLWNFYQHYHLNQMQCLTTDGYWIDPVSIDRKIAKYGGKEHPFIQSNVFGEFAKKIENALLSLSEFNACLASAPEYHPDNLDQHCFVDVAGGGAKNVMAHRVGNRIRIVKKWIEPSEMATCGEIAALYHRLKKEYGLDSVTVDASGAGKPMADRLSEMGIPVVKFFGGSAPFFDMDYANAISEAWGTMAKKIKECDRLIPEDDDFRMQMLTRPLRRNSSGKFQIQPKEEYCKQHPSPDEADAVCGANLPMLTPRSFNLVSGEGSRESVPDERSWRQRARDEGMTDENQILPAEGCL